MPFCVNPISQKRFALLQCRLQRFHSRCVAVVVRLSKMSLSESVPSRAQKARQENNGKNYQHLHVSNVVVCFAPIKETLPC